MQLVTLYVVADKYGIIGLKINVIHQLWKLLGFTQNEVKVEDNIIEYVYGNTLDGSKLRKLFVHWQAHSTSFMYKNKMKLVSDYPEYAADLLARMSECQPNPWLKSNGKTPYHEHLEEGEAEKESDDGSGDDRVNPDDLRYI